MSQEAPKAILYQIKTRALTLLAIFVGALSVFLFTPTTAHGTTLPSQCSGSINDYNVIEGTSEDETLFGTAGNDFILGNGGNDNINGNGGNDCIMADGGTDNITTGSGNDVVLVGGENNIINAGDGDNTIIAGSGRDNITVGSGNDTIVAGDGNNTIRSGSGNDTVTTGAGNDYINGGSGTDSCSAGGGRNIIVNCETADELPDQEPAPDDSGDDTDGEQDDGTGNDDQGGQDSGNEGDEDDNSSGGGETSPGPTVGNGITLGSGGGVPPVTVREETISSPVPGRVVVTWRTNIPASSQIVYGLESQDRVSDPPNYGYKFATPEDIYLTTTHRVEIGGIVDDLEYFFRPVSDVINSTEGTGKELTYSSEPSETEESNELLALASETSGTPITSSDEETLVPPTSEAGERISPEVVGTLPDAADAEESEEASDADEEDSGEEGLALLFGVIPMTGSQFFLALLIIIVLVIIIWWIVTRNKGHQT